MMMNEKRRFILRWLTLALCLALCLAHIAPGLTEETADGEISMEMPQEPLPQEAPPQEAPPQEAPPHTEHDFSIFVQELSPATCVAYAVNRYKCSGCEETQDRSGDTYGSHELTSVEAKAATCAREGNIAYSYCNTCGKYFNAEGAEIDPTSVSMPVNPDAHDWNDGVVDPEATCLTDGVKTYTCINCGTTRTEAVPAPGHNWNDGALTPATCSAPGNRHYTCLRCGTEKDEPIEIDPNAHDWQIADFTDATCLKPEIRVYKCAICGATKEEEYGEIDPNAHYEQEREIVLQPTCQTDGKYIYTCGRCGLQWEEIIPATPEAHQWDAGVVTTPATTEAPGVMTYTCTVCGETKTEEIPVISTCTVTWRNEWKTDNPVLKVDENVVIGTAPAYTGETAPTKAADANNTYPFTGWVFDPALNEQGGVTGDTIATAQFGAVAKIKAFPWQAGTASLTYKPDLATAQKIMNLPAKIDVTLSDDTVLKDVGLIWDYAPYNALPGDGDYVFTSALAEGSPALMDGVAMPSFTLHVGPATAADGSCTYRLNAAGELTIEKWIGAVPETGIVAVLSPLDGYPVVGVGPGAFQGMATLARLELPAGVKTLGDAAFADCPALTTLVLPDSLEPLVAPNLILNDAALANLVLRTSLDSTLTAVNIVERDVAVEGQEQPTHVVTQLPLAVTDILVSAGTFTVGCNYTVAVGHAAVVAPAAALNVAAGATLTNMGTVDNQGAVTVAGTVFTCAGAWSNNAATVAEGGKYVKDHQYSSGKCTICGTEDPDQVTEITASYVGSGLDKVFDHTRNVTLKASDLKLNGVRAGDEVTIVAPLNAEFDKADAGDRKVTIGITLGGKDAKKYTIKSFTVAAKITPMTLTLTPYEGQKKTYGAKDPTTFGCGVKPKPLTDPKTGVQDKATGRLTRESGEDVGKYKILIGTISLGSNYKLNLVDVYFTIEAKSINSSDIGLVTIGNQRYTGQPITPDVTLRFGTKTLVKDTDFKVTYSENTQPGTAKVKLVGMGNYTGERETTFKILNVADGGSSGGGSSSGSYSGGGSYSDSSFDDGEEESDEDFEDEEEDEEIDPNTGKLFLKDETTGEEVDYGTILYRANGQPAPFVQFVEKVEPEQPAGEDEPEQPAGANEPDRWTLTIIPDPLEDKETEETLYLDETGEREKYDELHLRLSQSVLNMLTQKGFTDIIYEYEKAEVRIPIASLKREIPLIPAEQTAGDDELELVQETSVDVAGEATEIETIKVAIYDVCVEQSENLTLTDRETEQMDLYKPFTGAYRVRVGVITEGEAAMLADAADAPTVDDATKLTLSPADELPENCYPEGVRLLLAPLSDDAEDGADDAGADAAAEDESEDDEDEFEDDEDGAEEDGGAEADEEDEVLASAPKDAATLYMSYYPPETDENGEVADGAQAATSTGAQARAGATTRDVVEINPTTFVNEEGMLYAEILPRADGLYAVGIPKTDEELAADIAARAAAGDEDAEGEFEDLDGGFGGMTGTSFGMGASFSVDENGNAVFDN